jgi:AcrR family transcriptional regulator
MSPSQSLPRGRHSIPRAVVVDNQRTRLLDGVCRALAERCYGNLAISHVTAEAGVSRATFYEIFDGKRHCVLAAHVRAFDRLVGRIEGACTGFELWEEKLAAGLAAGIRFAVESPDEARLLVLRSIGADRELAEREIVSRDRLVEILHAGRSYCADAAALPEVTERVLVGSVTTVASDLLMAGGARDLIDLEPQLLELLLMPYRGN